MRKSSNNSQLVDLRALQAFVAVNEAGSMSLAAKRLGVSQSAISQLIQSLEADYGVALFDRDVRPSRPTRSGQILLELANSLLIQARSVNEQVRAGERQQHAQIRFGCVDSFAATLGPSMIRGLSNYAREIQMWSGLITGLIGQLESQELDLAITTDTTIEGSRINKKFLFSEEWVAVFPRKHITDNFIAQDLLKIAGDLPLVRYSKRSVTGRQIERYIRYLGVMAPRRFEFDATDPIVSLVAAGLGWTITTPLCLLQARHHLEEVTVLPLADTSLGKRDFFLVTRDGEWSSLVEMIFSMTSTILKKEILPAVRTTMELLPADVIKIPED